MMKPSERRRRIFYRAGYKYQLAEAHQVQTEIRPGKDVTTEWLHLSRGGSLSVRAGYAWDGPSGPALDSKCLMRASMVHDALYQLIRLRHLPTYWRKAADRELQRIAIADGMGRIRAAIVYQAVRIGGKDLVDPADLRPMLVAP